MNSKLLPAIASVGIAAGTEEIPIWDFIADGVAGWKAYEAIKAGMEVYEKANKIKTMVDAFTAGLAVAQNGALSLPFDAPALPSQTYVSPVAG